MLERLDFWLMVITLSFLAWLESRALRRKIIEWTAWFRSQPVSRLRSEPLMSRAAEGGSMLVRSDTNHSGEPDTHQVELTSFPTEELIRHLTDRGLTRDQFLTLLAKVKKMDGDLWLSANRISATIGGTNAENLAVIRTIRGDAAPARPAHPAARLERPRGGW